MSGAVAQGTHLDKVGVPGIPGDAEVIVALLLERWVNIRVLTTGFPMSWVYLFRRTPEDVAFPS